MEQKMTPVRQLIDLLEVGGYRVGKIEEELYYNANGTATSTGIFSIRVYPAMYDRKGFRGIVDEPEFRRNKVD
jgi:hypothetical protein